MSATPPRKPLQEKDFIQDSFSSNPFPFWLWLVLLAILAALFWGGSSWLTQKMSQEVAESPFLQVTNRQFSIFLWQFPEHMRISSSSKTAYLPGFQYQGKVSMYLEESDKYIVAPPATLFLYHAWNRLISKEYASRPIPTEEFQKFLSYAEEWQPKNWPEAPKEYGELVLKLSDPATPKDLQTLPESSLPRMVRQAFQGWRNYFKEGDQINAVQPTFEEMQRFLQLYPHYARNNWRNILLDHVPDYLKGMEGGPGLKIPADQLAPFLKAAFFNYQQAQKPNP
jgi:hypothetical protein